MSAKQQKLINSIAFSDEAREKRTNWVLRDARKNCGISKFQRTVNEVQRLHSILAMAAGWTENEQKALTAFIDDKKIAARLNEIYDNLSLS